MTISGTVGFDKFQLADPLNEHWLAGRNGGSVKPQAPQHIISLQQRKGIDAVTKSNKTVIVTVGYSGLAFQTAGAILQAGDSRHVVIA